ncbi:MAG: MFS transporter [Sphingomonadales bacterium]|nr:MFS transporter [Sphingomonadales bacterium]
MTGPAPAARGIGTILALAAISALGSMAIHMLVPALPALARELHLTAGEAQAAISVYLAGLGAGQLLAGPVTDRIGRRAVMLAGLALTITGALGSTLAPTLPALIAARLVQAIGGAAGVVTARVMVSDLFGEAESARRQATLMMVVLVSPALAPVFGGVLAAAAGWRSIPAVLAALAAAMLAFALLRLPETRAPDPAPVRSRTGLAGDLARLARNRTFLAATVALAGGSSTLYMFLASAAFLLVRSFGLGESQAGPWFLAVAAASICGTRLVGPVGRHCDTLRAGAALICAGAIGEWLVALAGGTGPLALVAPVMLVGLGAGLVGPSAITAVAFAEPGLAGTATSIAGAAQMLASSLATALLGRFAPVDMLRLGNALAISGTVALVAAGLRPRRA